MFALAGAVFGLAAVGSAVPAAIADRSIDIGVNGFVNPPRAIHVNTSPAVAVNPTNERNIVIASRVDRPRFSAEVHWSLDGGRNWRTTALPLPEGKDRAFAADAVFAPDGTLYVSYVNLTGTGNIPENLWVARSTNGGQTLQHPPTRVAGGLTFQPRIAAARDGVLHLTWTDPSDVGLLRMESSRIVAVGSSDGGRTWSRPVVVSDATRTRVGAAVPVVAGGRDLLIVYKDFKDDVRDFGNLEGPAWQNPFALVASRSDDGGRTFSPGIELESGVVPTRRFLVFLPEFHSAAAGLDGSVYVAWADGRNGDEDVFLRRSSDGGRTWTSAVRVNDNAVGDGTDQWLPAVDVGPDGRVDVLFLDRRRDPTDNIRTDASMTVSWDGGRTFRENFRLTPTAFDSSLAPTAAPHLPPDIGSRIAVRSTERGAFAAWSDARLGNEATGRHDVAMAFVDMPDAGQGPWPYLVGGFVVAGAASLAGWRTRTRRTPEV